MAGDVSQVDREVQGRFVKLAVQVKKEQTRLSWLLHRLQGNYFVTQLWTGQTAAAGARRQTKQGFILFGSRDPHTHVTWQRQPTVPTRQRLARAIPHDSSPGQKLEKNESLGAKKLAPKIVRRLRERNQTFASTKTQWPPTTTRRGRELPRKPMLPTKRLPALPSPFASRHRETSCTPSSVCA